MRITTISDLHGFQPDLPGGDLLIVAGDLTARDVRAEYNDVATWLENQNYEKIILVAGNHDNFLEKNILKTSEKTTYLCDSSIEFKGLRIYGTPWSKWFVGINPNCEAFTKYTEKELLERFVYIRKDTDILVTHTPPYGILDLSNNSERCGSEALRNVIDDLNIMYHFFGHIHENGLQKEVKGNTTFVNCSYVDERYLPRGTVFSCEI